MNTNKPMPRKITPLSFMKNRHPEMFSDSKDATTPRFDKKYFGFILENITANKQEYDFEEFCYRLAKLEICQNITPQTGPTGGGDGKVDAETYPVSPSVSRIWSGVGIEATSEKWAFAFSAMKAWKKKAESDIQKIAALERQYVKVFYFTSQLVKSDKRFEFQTLMEHTYGFKVEIIDRNWIIDRVFDNKRFDIAIETLHLEIGTTTERLIGPQDAKKSSELENIEKQIEEYNGLFGFEYHIAEDCFRAALLARGLGHPKQDVDSKFLRAINFSKDYCKNERQLLRFLYNRAWTLFFWYEDYLSFLNVYLECETTAKHTLFFSDMEMIANLWMCASHGEVPEFDLEDRVTFLRSKLEEISTITSRPGNGLSAKFLLLTINVKLALSNREPIDNLIQEMIAVTKVGGDFPDFSMGAVIDFVEAFQDVSQNPFLDDLFAIVVDKKSSFLRDVDKGEMLLNRGISKTKAALYSEAIALFGQTLELWRAEELTEGVIITLQNLCITYELNGNLWAARSSILATLQLLVRDFDKKGKMSSLFEKSLNRLIWIELRLGRLMAALFWMDFQNRNFHVIDWEDGKFQDHFKKIEANNNLLSQVILVMDKPQLLYCDNIHLLLKVLGPLNAYAVFMYITGKEIDPGLPGLPIGDLGDLVRKYRELNDERIPNIVELFNGNQIEVKIKIYDSVITVICDNNPALLSLSETIVSSFEATFSTERYTRPKNGKTIISMTIGGENFLKITPIQKEEGLEIKVAFPPLPTGEKIIIHDPDFLSILINMVSVKTDDIDFDLFDKQVALYARAFHYTNIADYMLSVLGRLPNYKFPFLPE